MKKYSWMILSMAIVFGSCGGQNPYPADVKYVAAKAPAESPVVETLKEVIPFSLDVPRKVDFQEGIPGSFLIDAQVPAPGKAIVTLTNLPEGAVFDASTKEVTWTPSLDSGHDPRNPKAFFREYEVTVALQSDQETVSVVRKKIALIVWNIPKPLKVHYFNGQGQAITTLPDIREGELMTLEMAIESSDFPEGPFNVRIDNLPMGASLTRNEKDPSRFGFKFQPDFQVAWKAYSADAIGHYKELNLQIVAEGPRATSVTEKFTFRVYDVRQEPLVDLPREVSMSYGGSFSIIAEDKNGERSPSIDLAEAAPFGSVTLNESAASSQSGSQMRTLKTVTWSGIPDSALGTSEDLRFRVCTLNNDAWTQTLCVYRTVKVFFVGKPTLEPQFDRVAWPADTIKSMAIGDRIQISIPVDDPNSNADVAVQIEPASMRHEVSYKDGSLTIEAKTAGFKAFTLVGVSSSQLMVRESFSFRVLPKQWSKILLLGEVLNDPEMQGTLALFKDVELLNPSFTPLSDEELSGRSVLFVTTNAMKSGPRAPLDIGNALSKVHRAIVSSPAMVRMPKLFFPEGLTLVGRYSDLAMADKPNLSSVVISSKKPSVFISSRHAVRLQQSLTNESLSPLVFSVRPGSDCETVLSLTKDTFDFPVAVECRGQQGRKMLFVGFEWADMIFDSSEENLASDWLQSWIHDSGSHDEGDVNGEGDL